MSVTPKSLGMSYDRRHAVWGGNTPATIVPASPRRVPDANGDMWCHWVADGFRWSRNERNGDTFAHART